MTGGNKKEENFAEFSSFKKCVDQTLIMTPPEDELYSCVHAELFSCVHTDTHMFR